MPVQRQTYLNVRTDLFDAPLTQPQPQARHSIMRGKIDASKIPLAPDAPFLHAQSFHNKEKKILKLKKM